MPHQGHHRRHVVRDALPEPAPVAEPEPAPAPVMTYYSIVYVTATPTFTGSYSLSTQGADDDSTTADDSEAATSAEAAATTTQDTSATTAAETTTASSKSQTTMLTSTTSVDASLPIATDAELSSSSTTTLSPSTAAAAQASASASSTSDAVNSSGGMSDGAKAGLAVGLILLIGCVIVLVLSIFRKKKRQAEQQRQLQDEKAGAFGGAMGARSTRSANTNSLAPQVSIRPVTQFRPDLSANSAGAAAAWRPAAGQGQDEKENPFGHHAEPANTSKDGTVIGAAAAGAAVVPTTLKRGASKRANMPKEMDFTKTTPGNQSPTGTEFSMNYEPGTPTQTSGALAITAAGGPSSSVHRVQLDFKASMEDEMDLGAGQLIRLLHEYDDGWALVIRLDRSKQGVVPRTCLSSRPVKPRPQQNGPRGPPPGMRVPQQVRPSGSPGYGPGPPRPLQMHASQGPPRSNSPSTNLPPTPTGPQYKPQQPPRNIVSLPDSDSPVIPRASVVKGKLAYASSAALSPVETSMDTSVSSSSFPATPGASNAQITAPTTSSPATFESISPESVQLPLSPVKEPMATPTFGNTHTESVRSLAPAIPRPVTPTEERSVTPVDNGFNFGQSTSPPPSISVSAPSPEGTSPVNGVISRKPVPGQAL